MSKSIPELRAMLSTVSGVPAKKAILSQIKSIQQTQQDEEEALRHRIRKCRECSLNRERMNAVPWSGPPRGRGDLIVVGEAPGQREDSKGIPFVGPSGKILDHALSQAGTDRRKVFVCNTLCCRPPNNRDPRPTELEACQPNFEDQLKMSGLMVGVTLGGYALANVMGVDRKDVQIGKYLDKPVWVDGRIWIPTYHPAYILRARNQISTLINSIRFALAIRFGDGERTPLPTPIWDQVKIDGKRGNLIGPVVEKKGYALVYSRTLGTQIVVVKVENSRVPDSVSHLPRYTIDELMRVSLLGRGREEGWTKRALRTLNMVKYEFDGVVIEG